MGCVVLAIYMQVLLYITFKGVINRGIYLRYLSIYSFVRA